MLLCSSSGSWNDLECGFDDGCSREVVEDFAGDVSLQAADDLALAQAFGRASLDVVAGGLVMSHPDDGDDVEGAVRGPVSTAAEAVSAAGSAAAGWLWRDPAELGEGGFALDASGVVA